MPSLRAASAMLSPAHSRFRTASSSAAFFVALAFAPTMRAISAQAPERCLLPPPPAAGDIPTVGRHSSSSVHQRDAAGTQSGIRRTHASSGAAATAATPADNSAPNR
jgi:hypothetical protein